MAITNVFRLPFWIVLVLMTCLLMSITPVAAAPSTSTDLTTNQASEPSDTDELDTPPNTTAETTTDADSVSIESPDALPVLVDNADKAFPMSSDLANIIAQRNIDITSADSIGMALFSAESQAEIDALTPLFEEALARKRGMSTQAISDWKYAPELLKKLVNDMNLSKKINMNIYTSLKKGDILLRRTGINGCKFVMVVPLCKYWAFMYEHAGLYYGYRSISGLSVYESTNVGGVQFKPLSTWQKRDMYVGIYRSRVSGSKIASTFERLIGKYGYAGKTPYNYNLFNKYTDSALYCSQLVWKFYSMMGVNVDSNHPLYGAWLRLQYGDTIGNYAVTNAVAPDEVGMSSNIYRLANGWNQ